MLFYAGICQENERKKMPQNTCKARNINTFQEVSGYDKNLIRLPRQDVRNPPKPLKINGFEPLSVSTLPTFYQQQRANRYNTPKHPLRRLSPSSGCFFIPPPSSPFPLPCSMIAKIQVPLECDKIAL